MIARLLQSAALGLFVAANVHAQTPLPDWARARWDAFAVARSLQRSTQVREQTLTGDFDGDGLPDVAMVVEHRVTKKIGIVFLHQRGAVTRVIGAGTEFGNGGDNFEWMDSWSVQPRTKSRWTDAVVLSHESSASALVYFARGKYRWKQLGD